jgi:hypothetical protein
MSDDIKRIPIKELREMGFIQEINRRLLHPCGLALEVILDKETGEETLGGVWDFRDDPEGMYFGEEVLSVEKARTVDKLWYSKTHHRDEHLGYIVQPLPEPEKKIVNEGEDDA